MAMQALLDGDGEALTTKAIELAKAGDMQALKHCTFAVLMSLTRYVVPLF